MEHRGLVAGSVILILGAVVSLGLMATGPEEYPSSGPVPALQRELEDVLRALKRTWRPGEKAGVIEGFADRIERLKPPLLGLLAQPSHPLVHEAMELAAALAVGEAREAIVALAESGPAGIRPAAILAADRIEPWDREELAAFLREDQPPVLVAALKVASVRVERPFLEIIELFAYEDPEVRKAATEAIPYEMDLEILEELLSVARNATADQGPDVIRALSRTKLVAEVEAFLVAQVEGSESSLRFAALEALTAKGGPLRWPNFVWDVAVEPGEDPVLQAHAMYCLERTGSFSTAQIRSRLPLMGPVTRYFAARCLLTDGQKEAIGILLDLETRRRSGGFEELDPGLDAGLSVAVSQLVRRVRGRGRTDDLDLLWEWYAELEEVRPQKLPPTDFPPLATNE